MMKKLLSYIRGIADNKFIKKIFESIKRFTSNKIVKRVWKYVSNVTLALLVVLVIVSVYGNIKTKGKNFNVPSIGPYMWLSVLSDSMKPVFNAGDLIIDKKVDAEDLKVGDIVTFRWGTFLSTHRISEIVKDDEENLGFKTKGDNSNAVDDEVRKSSDIVGIYMFRIPFIGYILTKLKGLTGVILIWIMFAMVVGTEIYRHIKDSKKKTEEGVVEN